jgi:hypothetical protein
MISDKCSYLDSMSHNGFKIIIYTVLTIIKRKGI